MDLARKTVVCIASGPSITAEDCAAVRQSGLTTIAVNSSWKLASFCDILYAGDVTWWEANIDEIDIPAERWTCSQQAARRFGIQRHVAHGSCNSGLRAMQLAFELGAERVILLGYDCSVARGTHWHGDHTRTSNPKPFNCLEWMRGFSQLPQRDRVWNCSRETALTVFERMSLIEGLTRAASL